MTVNLETEIVATRFDPVTQTGFYTIERGGKRWTVAIPLADMNKLGANKIAKQRLLATLLNNAMAGEDDVSVSQQK